MDKYFGFELSLKTLVGLFFDGDWSCGFERWNGKPNFYIGSTWYDAPIFTFHLFSFWVSCDYIQQAENAKKKMGL